SEKSRLRWRLWLQSWKQRLNLNYNISSSDGPGGDDGAFFALRSCHQLLNSDKAEFFSPDYLCSNPPLWCNWTIQVDPGKRIQLDLEDLTPDDACHLKQDQIHVDEPAGQFGGHKVLQKCWREAKYTSSSNIVHVVLLIGQPILPYRGFFGRYQAFGPLVVYNPLEGFAERSRKPSTRLDDLGLDSEIGPGINGEQMESDFTLISFAGCVCRLNAGVLYILWLQIRQEPGTLQVHRSVHSTLQGLISTNVNECGTQLVLCDINADCVNQFGSYSCHCRPGFRDVSRLGSGGTICMDVKAAGIKTVRHYSCSSGLSPETKGVYVLFFLLSCFILMPLVVVGILYHRHHRGTFLVRCHSSSTSSPDLSNDNHHHDDNYSYPAESDLPPPTPSYSWPQRWLAGPRSPDHFNRLKQLIQGGVLSHGESADLTLLYYRIPAPCSQNKLFYCLILSLQVHRWTSEQHGPLIRLAGDESEMFCKPELKESEDWK
uniref:CUB domain-containing protein n=1 Tax=Anabas testudineus TaxID=64144 RepID=A0A3Q1J6P7_ANATE